MSDGSAYLCPGGLVEGDHARAPHAQVHGDGVDDGFGPLLRGVQGQRAGRPALVVVDLMPKRKQGREASETSETSETGEVSETRETGETGEVRGTRGQVRQERQGVK